MVVSDEDGWPRFILINFFSPATGLRSRVWWRHFRKPDTSTASWNNRAVRINLISGLIIRVPVRLNRNYRSRLDFAWISPRNRWHPRRTNFISFPVSIINYRVTNIYIYILADIVLWILLFYFHQNMINY